MGNFASKKEEREPAVSGRVITHETPPERRKTKTLVGARTTRSQVKKRRDYSNNDEAVSTNGTTASRNARSSSTKKRSRSGGDDDEKPVNKKPRYHKTWDECYADLCAFHKKYGHARVPSNEEHIALANWLYNQRKRKKSAYRGKMLSKEKIAKLDDLGVDWKIPKCNRFGG